MKPVVTILAVNTGSSSIKFSLYDSGRTEELLLSGALTRIGLPDGRFSVMDAEGRYIEFVKRSLPKDLDLQGIKVVVDCANGAAYKVAPKVLRT